MEMTQSVNTTGKTSAILEIPTEPRQNGNDSMEMTQSINITEHAEKKNHTFMS